MPKVLISDSLGNLAKEVFEKEKIEVDVNTDLSPSELKEVIKNYDGLIVRSATKVTKEIIKAGKSVKTTVSEIVSIKEDDTKKILKHFSGKRNKIYNWEKEKKKKDSKIKKSHN